MTMGLFDQAILGMGIITFLCALVTLVFIKKNRDFERLELEPGLNVLMFGMFFLFIAVLTDTLVYVEKNFHDAVIAIVPSTPTYLQYLLDIRELFLIPLFAVCFFVAVLLVRRVLMAEKKARIPLEKNL